MNKWYYIKGYDSVGYDVMHQKGQYDELLECAQKRSEIVAFNTLGFFKNKIILPLIESPYFGPNDGLFIRRDTIPLCDAPNVYAHLEIN